MLENKIISVKELWQFFNLSNSLFFIIGIDGYFKHINPAVVILLGFSEDYILSQKLLDFIHPDDIEISLQKGKELTNGFPIEGFSNRFRTANGSYRWLNWTVTIPTNEGYIYGIAQDWTERNKLQDQLVQERISKEKSVLEATIYGQEMERNEIGKELHDNIIQLLAATLLTQDAALHNEDIRVELIQKSISILKQAINEVRNYSHALVGPDARKIQLIDSINDLLDTVNKGKQLLFHFDHQCDCEGLPGKMKLMIFRIIQEQVNNIIKHAHAKTVNIKIEFTNDSIVTSIEDDGGGFDTNKNSRGIGLNNIASRAAYFGGFVNIDSALGKGCKLSVSIPLAENRRIEPVAA
jgi:PAS domain S-box-containing protein